MYAEVYESLGYRSRLANTSVNMQINDIEGATGGGMESGSVVPIMDGNEIMGSNSNNNASSSNNNSANTNNAVAAANTVSFPSIHHKDAFLLFRALCKLSLKGLHDDTGTMNDPIALQNKYIYMYM